MVFLVTYPDLSNLTNSSGVSGLLAFPNSITPYFWTFILAGIFLIISLSSYFGEKNLGKSGNSLSSMAVASLAVTILGTVGSLLDLLTFNAFLPILVFCIVIDIIWIFSSSK